MTTELRDGLARALLAHDEYTGLGFIRDREKAYWLEKADAALAFIQQHNDFARRVRGVAVYGARPGGFFPRSSLDEIVKLCDEELGNG